MLLLKDDSIELNALHPALALFIAGAVVPVFDRVAFGVDVVITSGSEQSARHGKTSLHYNGCAVDIRTIDQKTGERYVGIDAAVELLKAASNCDFDIIDEGDHLHIEYQPKRRG